MLGKADIEYDIFISYTQLDNKPLTKGEEGWISSFHYTFETYLSQLLGREPKIWRDAKLRGNDEFDKEIVSILHKTTILLTVISPRYFKSEWCMKELNEFLKGTGGNTSRIFKVIKTDVPHQQNPDEIRNLKGYKFCELDVNDRAREFRPEKGSPFHHKFMKTMEDVAFDIRDFIEGRDQQEVNPPEKTVYLAETTCDLKEERENICGELKQQGYTIFPDRHLPYLLEDGNFKDSVREYLKQCKLSIHLIGNQYGLIPEGEERSVMDLQNHLAGEFCENNQLTRVIWIPPGLGKSITDDRQRKYIIGLNENDPGVRTEILTIEMEDFKTVIHDTLGKISKPLVKPPLPDDLTRIYLVYDLQDKETVISVEECLYESDERFEVIPMTFEDKHSNLTVIHKDNLCLCDAILFYYNHASESWMNFKLNDLRKAPGYGRTKPLKGSAVFITGEKTEHKKRFRTREALVIKKFAPFSCEFLSPFISQLQGGNGGGR